MKKYAAFFLVIIAVYLATIFIFGPRAKNQTIEIKINSNQTKSKMKIASSAFTNNQNIPSRYSCDGEGINPPLEFKDIPANSKSLLLIMDDPDAPMGTFVHWVIFNIDPKTSLIAENSFPSGSIQGKNSASTNKYIGPCPPSGTHRYFFKLYALNSSLQLSKDAGKKEVEEAVKNHIISKEQLIGLYSRK